MMHNRVPHKGGKHPNLPLAERAFTLSWDSFDFTIGFVGVTSSKLVLMRRDFGKRYV